MISVTNGVPTYEGPINFNGDEFDLYGDYKVTFYLKYDDMVVTIYKDGDVLDSIREEGIAEGGYEPVGAAIEAINELLAANLEEIMK